METSQKSWRPVCAGRDSNSKAITYYTLCCWPSIYPDSAPVWGIPYATAIEFIPDRAVEQQLLPKGDGCISYLQIYPPLAQRLRSS